MIYEILEADTAGDLGIKVNRRLAEGWELYGDPLTAIKPETSELRGGIGFAIESKIMLFQAVVKNEPGDE